MWLCGQGDWEAEPATEGALSLPHPQRDDASLSVRWRSTCALLLSPPRLSGQTPSRLPPPHIHITPEFPTITLCSEGKGPVVCDHFKLLVPNGSHTGDAGHGDKALRVGVLRKKVGLHFSGCRWASLGPPALAKMRAAGQSAAGGQR
jgi:hypothetical protein